MKVICDIRGEGDRDEVNYVEVSLGKRKDIRFFEWDENEIRKSEYLKKAGIKVGELIPGVPTFICNVNDLGIEVEGEEELKPQKEENFRGEWKMGWLMLKAQSRLEKKYVW